MDHLTANPTTRIRPDIITDQFLATLRNHGVTAAYLFGSVARGEEKTGSDIDVFVTFGQPDDSFGEQLLLAEHLELLCGRRVDVLTSIHPAFAPYITPTLVPLPV